MNDERKPALERLFAAANREIADETFVAGVMARTRALNARNVVDSYMADHDGGCPPGGLDALKGADGLEEIPKDAWGKPLRLDCPGRDRARYDLTSDGPDGKRGGLDRIE